MLSEIDIRDVLFLDIETVSQLSSYNELPEKVQVLWDKKSSYFRKEDEKPEDVYRRMLHWSMGPLPLGWILILDTDLRRENLCCLPLTPRFILFRLPWRLRKPSVHRALSF